MANQLRLAHLYIESAKDKQVDEILQNLNNINVLALTVFYPLKNLQPESHNFKLYTKDSDKMHHVFFYIHSDLSVIKRSDLDDDNLETIWVDIPLLDNRPMLVGCCYTTRSTNNKDLENFCEQIEMVSIEDKDILFLGEFKKDGSIPRIDFVSSVCGLTQINSTRRTQYISTNIPDSCKPVSQLTAEYGDVQRFTVARNLPTDTDELTKCLKPLFVGFKVSKVFEVLNDRKQTELITRDTFNEIITQWTTDVNNHKKVGVILIDFTFPCGVISYDLLSKMNYSSSAISMMRSFLFDEKSSSCWWKGANRQTDAQPPPRESSVTLFLLSVYINNLSSKEEFAEAKFAMSSSQLMMYLTADPGNLKKVLTDASNSVRCWLSENKLVLTKFKSAMMTSKKQVDDVKARFHELLRFN